MGKKRSDDADLMARLGRGDMAALGELARRHQNRIFSVAYRILGDWHRAEDVTQEVFLRLHQAAEKYEPQARFTTWLYRIVYNLSIDHQRKLARDFSPLESTSGETEREASAADDVAEKTELARLVRDAVNSLSERQRHVVILHRYEGLSHAEISEVTGWSRSAVESLLVRAYENLRKKLVRHQNFAS